jgi:hypothetical protein
MAKKLKKFIVSHTIYISVDIEAKSEEEALEQFEQLMQDPEWHSWAIVDSDSDTEATEIDE